MSFELKPLPYEEHALEPAIGRETVSIHYHKHHAGYVSKLNAALKRRDAKPGTKKPSLEQVIETARRQKDQSVYNLAAQAWNHDFYWQSMTPEQTSPGASLREQIEQRYDSIANFEEAFKTAALNQFGSGWTWLCWNHDAGKLDILSTSDAVIPPPESHLPLLTLDVWEHAYYLDYRNDRAAYIEQFLDRLINWDTAGERLQAALAMARQSGPKQAVR